MALFKKGDVVPAAPAPEGEFHISSVHEVLRLPDFLHKKEVDVRYPLLEPYAYVHIHWSEKDKEIIYEVEEPVLAADEEILLARIEEGIEELINISFLNIKEERVVVAYLEKNIRVLLAELGAKPSHQTFLKLMYYVYRDFVGLNKIEALMHDYFIEDIECNGANTPLYIVHRKYRNLKTNITFKKMPQLTSFVEKLAQKCGKYISYASPILDGRLPDKSRVNATYTQEISSHGPTFTIRKFTAEPWSPVKLMQVKTVSPEILAYLWLLIEHDMNFMVIGGTGAGKTSFLNSIAFFIPPQARIVSIEDTHELNLLHENWLPSVVREAVGTGSMGKFGEVSLFTLLKASFRQRPDYVIVGEIRGEEAFVLFQGAASGHPTASTMHAEDVETMLRRLQTPPLNLPAGLVETLDVVCVMTQTRIAGENVRRLRNITEIIEVGKKIGTVRKNIPFVWDPRSDNFFFRENSYIFQKIEIEAGLSKEFLQKEFERRTKLLWEMYKQNILGHKEVQEIIDMYYKSPGEVLKRFNIA